MASADIDLGYRPYWQDPSALDPTGPGSRRLQAPDALDALLDFDTEENNASRTMNADASGDGPARGNGSSRGMDGDTNGGLGLGLGIDEEVKVRKPRAPIARLDEERLLSANGIPKLRKISKERLKFRGKGHEFSDISRLLNTYQLWLDDLFPKAKFADGLAIIEKLGHKKQMQVMRKAWIDEGKPKTASQGLSEPDDDFVNEESGQATSNTQAALAGSNDNDSAITNEQFTPHPRNTVDNEDDDDIYADPSVPMDNGSRESASRVPEEGGVGAEPDRDELDELLAENAITIDPESAAQKAPQPIVEEDFADDEEAMAELW